MDIITTFGVRGKFDPKNGPQSNGCFGGLLKKRLKKEKKKILGKMVIFMFSSITKIITELKRFVPVLGGANFGRAKRFAKTI